jgi:hypothetical protein
VSSRRRNTRPRDGSRTRPGCKTNAGGTVDNGAIRRDPSLKRGKHRRLYSRRRLMVSSHPSLHSPLIRSMARLRDNRRTGISGSLGRLPEIVVGPHGGRGRSATKH